MTFCRISLVFILIASFSFGPAFGQVANVPGRDTHDNSKTRDVASGPQTAKVKPEDVRRDIAEALAIIQKNYGGSKEVNYNDLFRTTFDTMLHSLDPHSNYFDAKEFEQFKTDQSSRYFGIGATIGDLSDADGKVIATYIKATFDGARLTKRASAMAIR